MDTPGLGEILTWIVLLTVALITGGMALMVVYRAVKELGHRGQPIGSSYVSTSLYSAKKGHEDEEACKESLVHKLVDDSSEKHHQ